MPYAKYHRKEKEKERRIRRRNTGELKKYYKYKDKTNWNKREHHPNWKGGKYISPNKYIFIYSPEHPFKDKNNYVAEHRLVMEKHLGRILLPTEVVHHINNNPQDNRIENLMLFSNQSTHLKFHHNIKMEEYKKT